jgi:hypothetical protein
MVAPVYTFDPKILPEGSAKLRWAGRGAVILCIFRGQIRSSEAVMGGEGGAQRPVWGWQWAQKDGCAQRTGAHAGPKPTSLYNRLLTTITEGLCGTGCWNRDHFWIIYNKINAYIRGYKKYWQIAPWTLFVFSSGFCFGSLTVYSSAAL